MSDDKNAVLSVVALTTAVLTMSFIAPRFSSSSFGSSFLPYKYSLDRTVFYYVDSTSFSKPFKITEKIVRPHTPN